MLDAAILAVEAVDVGVGAVVSAIRAKGGAALVTADHGNAERMIDADGLTPFTAHTSDDVPLIAVVPRVRALRPEGILADVAPTILDAIGIEQPPEWTGTSRLIY